MTSQKASSHANTLPLKWCLWGSGLEAKIRVSLQEGVKTENGHINLKVAGQDGSVVQFKIKRHTPLSKLMKAYCERQVCGGVPEHVRLCVSLCAHASPGGAPLRLAPPGWPVTPSSATRSSPVRGGCLVMSSWRCRDRSGGFAWDSIPPPLRLWSRCPRHSSVSRRCLILALGLLHFKIRSPCSYVLPR